MVPIHDTDVAEERWTKSSWRNFELWEKIELRLRRRKRFWVVLSVILFLILSAIPVWTDQKPHWVTLSIAREVATLLATAQTQAAQERSILKITLTTSGSGIEVRGYRVSTCQDPIVSQPMLYEKQIMTDQVQVLTQQLAADFGFSGVVTEICRNPFSRPNSETELQAMGLIPREDIISGRPGRLNRMVWLVLHGDRIDLHSQD